MAQVAIDQAENGDYNEVKRILSLLQKPFDDWPTDADSDVTDSHVEPGKLLLLPSCTSVTHLTCQFEK